MDNHTDCDNAPPVQSLPNDIRPTLKHNYAEHEAESSNDLLEHGRQVCKRITRIAEELILRGVDHDQSKFSPEEYSSFANQTIKLKDLVYGSDEYRSELEKIRPAIDHHYKHNRHHPQHFKNRIRGMDLIDIIEMFCDWHASALRQKDGNVRESITFNQKRFKLSDELTQIFFNTLEVFKEL